MSDVQFKTPSADEGPSPAHPSPTRGARSRVSSQGSSAQLHGIVLCTVATHRNAWLDQWEESARLFAWDYHVLGMGHKWEGFQTKVRLVREFCARQKADMLVCVTDSYDLVLSGTPQEMVAKYNGLPAGQTIVVGAEGRVGPNSPPLEFMSARPEVVKRNLNMGFIVGRAAELSGVYAFALETCPHGKGKKGEGGTAPLPPHPTPTPPRPPSPPPPAGRLGSPPYSSTSG